MEFKHNGISVSVGDAEVRRLVLERLQGSSPIISMLQPPAIGAEWPEQGGTYAGIARGFDGERDYHLIVGREHPDGEIDWNAMQEWAKTFTHAGFSDYAPIRRKEQALCFANVPELFRPIGYWSGEQHASDSDSAYCQYFDYGDQHYWDKYDKLRARLVRRLTIQ